MISVVIGMGEIGSALHQLMIETYGIEETWSYDAKDEEMAIPDECDFLHICVPHTKTFINMVGYYIRRCNPKYTIIHSSVPVGTTEQIKGAFHSPVRGKHPDIYEGLKKYVKYISYNLESYHNASKVADYFTDMGIETKLVSSTKTTELMKLLALSRYGVYIAFAKEQEKICQKFGLPYDLVVSEVERTRNEKIEEDLKQPILYPFKKYVGGHCTVEDMKILLDQIQTPLLKAAYEIDKGTKIWDSCNIYDTAVIGKGCNIGQFCEIGHNVKIGNNVRIGAYSFIPEGVTIEDDVFIAPKTTISNDKHPPSNKAKWGRVLIKKGAVIGMGSIILPCVTIGENAVVGAGSVVTKDVQAGEVVYGQAAYSHGKKGDIYK